jgi:hypothetical protein
MYDEYSQYYENCCCSNSWAAEDSSICGCKGKGWWLSELDTWHQCPCHGKDVPHPESYDYEEDLQVEVEAEAKQSGMTLKEYLDSLALTNKTNIIDNDDGIPF